MADGGGWPGRLELDRGDPDGADVRHLYGELQGLLGELTRRLSAPDATPLSSGAGAALIPALERLADRIARQAGQPDARRRELEQLLAALIGHLRARAAADAAPMAGQAAPRPVELTAAASDPASIRAILALASAAATLSVAAAAVLAVTQPQMLPAFVAQPLQTLMAHPSPQNRTRIAIATPDRIQPVAAGGPVARADGYDATRDALARGEAGALPRLTGLAEAGDARAQMHLATLYEAGDAGLARDLAAARLWTRRAAMGGERAAMHNLAIFLADGEGGPRDVAEAAIWFRRAADRGVVDSQYDLGLLYEAGRGVPRNLREAYRWYAVAANAGDMAAREKQVALEARLGAVERAGLDREAAAYRPGDLASVDPAPVVAPATTLAETQALLARQGYYLGPIDGAPSAALKAAAIAYLRDHPGAAPTS